MEVGGLVVDLVAPVTSCDAETRARYLHTFLHPEQSVTKPISLVSIMTHLHIIF
jgi:hypothetical protein